jgi:hypothetical protein
MKAVKTMTGIDSKTMRLVSAVLGSVLLLSGMCPPLSAQEAKPDNSKNDSAKEYGPTYRLTYTLTEMDGTKRLGAQRFSTTLTPMDHATIKVGSKVPIVTGSLNSGSVGAQTQFTYVDVGVNIDARLSQFANGMLLTTKVERLSVADMTSEEQSLPQSQELANFHEPVIRQASIANTALLQLGKSVMLGTLDTPGSARHVDVEVLMELVK